MPLVKDKIVYGDLGLEKVIPPHLSFTKYALHQLTTMEDGVALINAETGKETTRKQILADVVTLAAGLRTLKVKPGDVVGICSENRDEYFVIVLASLICGAVVTTANVHYSEGELTHVLNISRPSIIFCSGKALERHASIIRTHDSIHHIIQLDLWPAVPGSEYFPWLFEMEVRVEDVEIVERSGDDVLAILFSSGTTGLPKGVELTHFGFLYYTFVGAFKHPEKRQITVVPWFHAYGFTATMVDILGGRLNVYLPTFNPNQYLETVQKYKIEVLLTVPPMLVFLAKSPLVLDYDLGSVKIIWCAAAPVSQDINNRILKRLPNCRGVHQAYGMTETSLCVCMNEEDKEYRSGSVGTPRLNTVLKVVDLESRQKLDVLQPGELCIKTPSVMRGYRNNKPATEEFFDEENFAKTGDVAYYDEDGYIYIVDRIKDLIKFNGYQVSPSEVESVLMQHPGVAEACVAGIPDEKCGELPTAVVVKHTNSGVSEEDLVQFVKDKLSPQKQLRGGIYFVKEIPKNPSGKLLRRNLKQMFSDLTRSKL